MEPAGIDETSHLSRADKSFPLPDGSSPSRSTSRVDPKFETGEFWDMYPSRVPEYPVSGDTPSWNEIVMPPPGGSVSVTTVTTLLGPDSFIAASRAVTR